MPAGVPIVGHHNTWLVVVSVLIAILAAHTTLDLAGRVTFAQGRSRLVWLSCGAFALGSGIWAMHYFGMQALELPVPVRYDWPTVLLSWAVAVAGVQVALFVLGSPALTRELLVLGSLCMGGGIAAMHYIGMAAMRLPADRHYSIPLVVLSIVLAVLISYAGIRVAFNFRTELHLWTPRKFLAAFLLGVAIPTTHYVGMAAVRFISTDDIPSGDSNTISISPAGLVSIALIIVLLLAFVTIASAFDRRLRLQEKQIAVNELQLRTIFDNMLDPIYVVNREMHFVRGNRAFYDVFALKNVSAAGSLRESIELRTPEGSVIDYQDWPARRAFRGDFLVQERVAIVLQGVATSLLVECTTSPIRDAQNNIDLVIVTFHDITERQRSNESRARLAAIVDSSQDAIVGLDEYGMIRSWNAAAEKIFGFTADEMLGESIVRLAPPERENESHDFYERIKRGETVEHVETIRRRKDGRRIHVSLTISPIVDEMGRIIGSSKTMRDITSRKMLERQLFQSQKMEAIGQLSGGIAHDFNNLLAVIVGNLSLIERLAKGNDAILKRLHSAQKASSRGADLIRRLLAFSSNEQLRPTSVSVNGSVQNMLELAGRVLGPEIQIATNLDPRMPIVFADAAGLESALLNLAVNARDAMPKGGSLTISTLVKYLDADYSSMKIGELRPGTYVLISVEDTGIGMSRETQDRAFEPFFTTKPRDKGTGLGLPMVYGFARQSQGSVLIYSEVDHGTTVTIILPVVVSDAEGLKPLVSRARTKASHSSKVLIVDDELEIIEVADAYLTEMGHVTERALGGRQALDLALSNPDLELVITDVIMSGGMNGVELAREIRKVIPKIKVIYSSGFSADVLAKRNDAVFDGYLLPKPYQRVDFESIVVQALEEN
jgi:PAS domain S-box-containing protein